MARSLILLTALVTAGCYYPAPLYNPGSAYDQQARAIWFDPYPDPEAGPEVVGGRPLGYQNPVPETVAAQQFSPTPVPPTYQGRPPFQAVPATIDPGVPPAFPAIPPEMPLNPAPPPGYQPPPGLAPTLGNSSAPPSRWRY